MGWGGIPRNGQFLPGASNVLTGEATGQVLPWMGISLLLYHDQGPAPNVQTTSHTPLLFPDLFIWSKEMNLSSSDCPEKNSTWICQSWGFRKTKARKRNILLKTSASGSIAKTSSGPREHQELGYTVTWKRENTEKKWYFPQLSWSTNNRSFEGISDIVQFQASSPCWVLLGSL